MMSELTLVEAVCAALGRAMEEDPKVIIFGEDVGVDGGVFRATDGLVVFSFGTGSFDSSLGWNQRVECRYARAPADV